MRKYYDEGEVRHYIARHNLDSIIPGIGEFGKERLRLTRFKKGEVPDWRNESETLVFLVEGSVKNCAITQNGKKLLLHFSEGFEILRDLELLGIRNQNMEVEALDNPVFLEINLKGIRNILMDNPVFLRAILMQVGKKLAKTTIAQTMTAIYPLDSRLCSYILQMSEEKSEGTMVFRENLVETSELLGTSYRHLLRVLKDFCVQGVLAHEGKDYIIQAFDWLEEKASEQPIYGKYLERSV